MKFDEIFKGQPTDPIEFLYRENFITLSSIGSIFTFALIASFRENVFDKIMNFILPVESFDFMQMELPDIGLNPPIQIMDPTNPTELIDNPNAKPKLIHFGHFVRETLIWMFMILFLYILAIFIRWPQTGGIDFNTMKSKTT
jgi:hypothetical protein